MRAFSRRASTISARSNNSIISVFDVTPTTVYPLDDIQALHTAIGWLLNYTAAGIPPRSSLAYAFWNTQSASKHDWHVDAYKLLKNILAFTCWFFTENNYGNPDFDPVKQTAQGMSFLSREFHTAASTARQYAKFSIDSRMFVLYVLLQAIPLLFCWAVIAWQVVRGISGIAPSLFPMLDLYCKAELEGEEELEEGLLEASSSAFLERLAEVQVVRRRDCGTRDEQLSSRL